MLQSSVARTSTEIASKTSALLDRSLRAWVVDDNNERPNHGDYTARRIPLQVKKHQNTPISPVTDC